MSLKHLAFALSFCAFAGCGPAELLTDEVSEDEAGELDDFGDDAPSALEQGLSAPLLDAEEVAFLSKINGYRRGLGLSKLRVSIALSRAAEAHSKDMAETGQLRHESRDGSSFSTRVKRFYSCYTTLAENVAWGQSTGAEVFEAWKASSGHDVNMRNSKMRVIGISRVLDANGRSWWTTDFGDCVDAVLSAGFGTILSNGGFETDAFTRNVNHTSVRSLSRWHLYASSGGSCARTSSRASGSFGMRVADPDPGHASTTQLLKAASGVNYRATAVARRQSGASQGIYLDFVDGQHQRLALLKTATGTSSAFAPVSVSGTAPSGTRYVRVLLHGSGTGGSRATFDWDSVKVEAF